MRLLKPLTLAAGVAVGVTGVATTSFSEPSVLDRATVDAQARQAQRRRDAEGELRAYRVLSAAQEAHEQAQAQQFFEAVARQEQAEAAEAARRARAVLLAKQRAARNAGAARPATGNWAELINRYPWPTGTAYRVMMCESHGNANAYNPRSGATGLFQILGGPFDPAANVATAYRMWASRGWRPWAASRSCWA